MPVDGDDCAAQGERIRARFDAKVAKLRAKGVRVIRGSTLETKLWAAARRGR